MIRFKKDEQVICTANYGVYGLKLNEIYTVAFDEEVEFLQGNQKSTGFVKLREIRGKFKAFRFKNKNFVPHE